MPYGWTSHEIGHTANTRIKRTREVCRALLPAGLLAPDAARAASPQGGRDMDRPVVTEKNRQHALGDMRDPLARTDPDLVAMRDRLVYGEIAEQGHLDNKRRELITLVVLTAGQTLDDIKAHGNAALRAGATPGEIREALYQCAPYVGFPKTEAALRLINDVFADHGIALPLESRAMVNEATRFDDGLAVQKAIFGAAIDTMHRSAPDSQKAMVRDYLSAFCFGDIYTRQGLDLKTRELLTFSILSALGGCESQVRSHVQGNVNVGNSKRDLIDALAQSLPYMGFPRTLNALACVNAVLPEDGRSE